jgi:hypothetical protein
MMQIFTGYVANSIALVGVQIKLRPFTLAPLATDMSGASRTTDSSYTALNTHWTGEVCSILPVTSPDIIGASIGSTIRTVD